jgi:hypothetical protein
VRQKSLEREVTEVARYEGVWTVCSWLSRSRPQYRGQKLLCRCGPTTDFRMSAARYYGDDGEGGGCCIGLGICGKRWGFWVIGWVVNYWAKDPDRLAWSMLILILCHTRCGHWSQTWNFHSTTTSQHGRSKPCSFEAGYVQS